MTTNQEKVKEHYSRSYKEDTRATESRSSSLEFHYAKKLLGNYINNYSNVIEIGCGTGYYGMYFADKCSHYTGVDLTQANIDDFNQKIDEAGIKNISTMVGDATDLNQVPDGFYDVVLCLGPLYHVSLDEHDKVFAECYRIAKSGAVLAFAYQNRLGVYAGACVNWPEVYPNAETNRYVFELDTSDDRPGLFYFTSPEEIEEHARKINLEVSKNCGLSFFFAMNVINQMDDEKLACFMEIADRMYESPSCTGLANHALMICKKT